MILINEFNKSEEWFYDGNELILKIKATITDEKKNIPIEMSYNVTIKGYRGPMLQV